MVKAHKLTLAFLEAHPDDAARVLEQLTPQDAAAFLESIPVRLAAPVMRHMVHTTAARFIELLDDDVAAALLPGLGPHAAAAALRFLRKERRDALLGKLPTTTAVAVRMVLGYPVDAVGAWMDPRAFALSTDMDGEGALGQIRRSDDDVGCCVYAIGDDQRLRGIVRLSDIVKADPKTLLSQIMRPPQHVLSARASIPTIRNHPGWSDYPSLPVVERQERFVGALHYSTLGGVLDQGRQNTLPSGAEDAMQGKLALSYWQVVSSLIQAAVSFLPATGPRVQEVKKNER